MTLQAQPTPDVRALLAATANVYRLDEWVTLRVSLSTEVDGLPLSGHHEITLVLRGAHGASLTSNRTTIDYDGRTVWHRKEKAKTEQRWDAASQASDSPLPFLRGQCHRYHGRFAELDQARLLSEKVQFKRLRLQDSVHDCAVVRIHGTEPGSGRTGVEELWIDRGTHRVVRSNMTRRLGSGTGFLTTITTWTAVETTATPAEVPRYKP